MNTNKESYSIKEKDVIEQDLNWAEAHRELDIDRIEKIMSKDYQQRQVNGSLKGKAEVLASYRSGNRSWEIAESSDHHIKISGQLAIVIGRWRGKGINHGQAFDYRARFLSIYCLEDQVWRMIYDQSIPDF